MWPEVAALARFWLGFDLNVQLNREFIPVRRVVGANFWAKGPKMRAIPSLFGLLHRQSLCKPKNCSAGGPAISESAYFWAKAQKYRAYPRFFGGLQCNFQLKLEIAPPGGPAFSCSI